MVSVSKSHDPARSCRSQPLAHVPFDFVVGDQLLEAGPYSIEPSAVAGMLIVRRAGSDSQPVLVQAICQRRGAAHKLLFYCQQNLYFLAQVVVGLQ